MSQPKQICDEIFQLLKSIIDVVDAAVVGAVEMKVAAATTTVCLKDQEIEEVVQGGKTLPEPLCQ